MQREDSPLGRWWWVVLVTPFLLIIAADQLTKAWVRSYDEGVLIYQLGFIRLVHVENDGVAFGLFQGHSFVMVIVVAVGIIALLALGFFVYRRFPYLVGRLNTVGYSLILGGAVGNLVNRLGFDGNVTDFIDVGIWPAFNVADSAVTVGAIMVAISVLRLTILTRQRST